MNTGDVIAYVVQALTLTLILSMPAIAIAAIVGTLFSLVQALTQIQEQTLSFAIKLIAVGLTLFLTASWMGGELLNYTMAIFDNLPRVVN
jgi:type III secretion protein S